MADKLLLIDDDESFREVMRFHLAEEGYAVDVAPDGQEGLKLFQEAFYPLVVTDLKMPDMDGLTVMGEILKRSPQTGVVVITAFGDMDTAVNAMKSGAFDFIPKPSTRDHIKMVVKKAFEHVKLKTRVQQLEGRKPSESGDMVYQSRAMERVVELAKRVADSESTILVRGESGTGKEILARRIHLESQRSNGPFIPVNCASMPNDLLESELFGHVKGAFTGATRDHKGKFQLAHGGTIFLDEIGELPPALQPRLLRVLQEHTIDVVGAESTMEIDARVIAATNKNLKEEVQKGVFREDLYYRLNVVPLEIPPLRHRKQDIPLLARFFVTRYGRGRDFKFTGELLRALEAYSWPGNVRELDNLCQRMVLLADGEQLGMEQLPQQILDDSNSAPQSHDTIEVTAHGAIKVTIPADGASLDDVQKKIILAALEKNSFNQSKTARFLRIPRHVLLYRIEKFDIPLSK